MTLFDYDNEVRSSEGIAYLCGVDEAGRGPLAGPVCAAAVILPPGLEIEGLGDSKKLSEKKRELLFKQIREKALAWHIAEASVQEIEDLNILRAALLAMNMAAKGLPITPEFILVDGNKLPETGLPMRAVIGGDNTSASIAAASILAKVARDRQMLDLAEKYPSYHFEWHKGYGTKLHYQMLDKHGPCDAHRQSFLKKWRRGEKGGC